MDNRPALIDGSLSRQPGLSHPSARPGTSCDVRLNLSASAEQVVLVRAIVGALAHSLGLPDGRIHDVRLAVTEACTNVVRHAYDNDETGRLDVSAEIAEDTLTVIVADEGTGLRPRVETGPGGLGLPLMAALAERCEFGENEGRGTTVRLSFATAR